jgi:ABC-type glutathione transport system ATPase component
VQIERSWRYLALAVEPIEGCLSWCWIGNLKAARIATALQQWQQDGIEAVVVGRASGHRSGEAKEIGVVLVFQPPYSPELKPAERVFEELRRVIEGRRYGRLAEKRARVEEELRRLAADPERVKSLTGWSWIREVWTKLPLEGGLEHGQSTQALVLS